jgi:hypothetical protein
MCICYVEESRPPLWSSGQSSWLTDPEVQVRFPVLPDFPRTGTKSTQTRDYS